MHKILINNWIRHIESKWKKKHESLEMEKNWMEFVFFFFCQIYRILNVKRIWNEQEKNPKDMRQFPLYVDSVFTSQSSLSLSFSRFFFGFFWLFAFSFEKSPEIFTFSPIFNFHPFYIHFRPNNSWFSGSSSSSLWLVIVWFYWWCLPIETGNHAWITSSNTWLLLVGNPKCSMANKWREREIMKILCSH